MKKRVTLAMILFAAGTFLFFLTLVTATSMSISEKCGVAASFCFVAGWTRACLA